MSNTIEYLKNRARKLEQKDPTTNANIIKKLKRKIRALEKIDSANN